MDLTRAIGYRGFPLNTVKFDAVTRDMVGCEVTRAEYGAVAGVGYDEKRALDDGHDASDVFLSKRVIELQGNVYGRTRAEAYDQYNRLVDALTPTDAYESNVGQRGFVPLDFYTPTAVVAPPYGFPTGLIHQMLLARPSRTPAATFLSDAQGGQDDQGLAIPWSGRLEARIPHIVNYDWTTVATHSVGSGSGNLVNRGNRPAVIEFLAIVPPRFNGTSTGRIRFHIEGTLSFNFVVLSSAAHQIYRYNTHDKVLAHSFGGAPYRLRMDFLELIDGYPRKHLRPGTVPYRWWKSTGTLNMRAGSYIRFRDTWA